ncbi:MAG: hypothetical protein GWN85_40480 [Gemmatimonadetes bacterium]|nr:hypothetical protein [Gemmatimonadota bacterium]NIS37215.1 hypothetical protein [Actinomycetota bacterium]NIU66923.1 hypothetical protein [Actinomycetota bacterium]NIW28719.1 hypothetical protein [Actinomycetota bacterium]NIX21179.1 hypothetical protein [Actinomycetota bacterium]
MSATDHRERPVRAPLGRLPEFDLAFLYDDDDDPAEVTVFPARLGDDLATNWITCDVASAVPLESVR